jgi:hypothetical protein
MGTGQTAVVLVGILIVFADISLLVFVEQAVLLDA